MPTNRLDANHFATYRPIDGEPHTIALMVDFRVTQDNIGSGRPLKWGKYMAFNVTRGYLNPLLIEWDDQIGTDIRGIDER